MSRKKLLTTLLRIGFSVAVLAFVLSRVGLESVFAQLAGIDPWLYGLAALLYVFSVGIRAVRWRMMLIPLGITHINVLELTRLYLLGIFWDTFLPTGFGGDVVKAVQISKQADNTEAAITSVLAERVVGLLGTSLIALGVVVARPALVPTWVTLVIIAVTAAILLGGWLLRLNLLDWFEARIRLLRSITTHKAVRKVDAALKAYSLGDILRAMLTSLPFTVALVTINYLIGTALGIDITFFYYLVFIPVVAIVNLLPLSFNGIGVREALYQVLFGQIVGVGAGLPVALAVAFNLLRIGTGLLGGLISVVSNTGDLFTEEPSA